MNPKKTKILSKGDFFAFKKELVEVPELDGSVYVKELGGKSLLTYRERIEDLQKVSSELDEKNSLELMALLVSLTACDEEGDLIFSETDVKKLADTHIGVLLRLSTKALEVSGMGKAVIDEVADNLKNAQADSSTTS